MIFSKNYCVFVFKLRESVWNRLQIVPGCVRDVLTRSRASQRSPSFENIEKSPKIRGWQSNPLLRLSWQIAGKLLILVIFHDFFENFAFFRLKTP